MEFSPSENADCLVANFTFGIQVSHTLSPFYELTDRPRWENNYTWVSALTSFFDTAVYKWYTTEKKGWTVNQSVTLVLTEILLEIWYICDHGHKKIIAIDIVAAVTFNMVGTISYYQLSTELWKDLVEIIAQKWMKTLTLNICCRHSCPFLGWTVEPAESDTYAFTRWPKLETVSWISA